MKLYHFTNIINGSNIIKNGILKGKSIFLYPSFTYDILFNSQLKYMRRTYGSCILEFDNYLLQDYEWSGSLKQNLNSKHNISKLDDLYFNRPDLGEIKLYTDLLNIYPYLKTIYLPENLPKCILIKFDKLYQTETEIIFYKNNNEISKTNNKIIF